jgi:hypothetical protein
LGVVWSVVVVGRRRLRREVLAEAGEGEERFGGAEGLVAVEVIALGVLQVLVEHGEGLVEHGSEAGGGVGEDFLVAAVELFAEGGMGEAPAGDGGAV